MRGPPVPHPPRRTGRSTDELSINEELSIHAALAGVTLSHQAIPVLNADNDLSGVMNLGALFLVVGIVLVYAGERFGTRESGLRFVRTLSTVLFLYLLANGTNGLLSIAGVTLSATWASLLSLIAVLITAVLAAKLRGFQGLIDDTLAGKEIERDSDWKLERRIIRGLVSLLVFSVVVVGYLYMALAKYAAPAFAGVLASVGGIYIAGTVFYRKDQIHTDDNTGAEGRIVLILTTVTFMTVFVDGEWANEIAAGLGIVV